MQYVSQKQPHHLQYRNRLDQSHELASAVFETLFRNPNELRSGKVAHALTVAIQASELHKQQLFHDRFCDEIFLRPKNAGRKTEIKPDKHFGFRISQVAAIEAKTSLEPS